MRAAYGLESQQFYWHEFNSAHRDRAPWGKMEWTIEVIADWGGKKQSGRGPETWAWWFSAMGLKHDSMTLTCHGKLSAPRYLQWGQLVQRCECQIKLLSITPRVGSIRGIVAKRSLDQGCLKKDHCVTAWSRFSRETEPTGYIYKEISCRNWLMWLWRPRRATICRLQAGDLGKQVVGW